MDTEDPAISDGGIKLKVGGRDHDGKKKAKKKKEKMISLDEYQAKHGDFGAANAAPPSNNWAVMTETAEDDYESSFKFDRSQLPSAPKAAMGPSVDLSLIPPGGPFSAYIGNLSYDANEEDLHRLFSKLEIDTVRIIQDGGRPRGYAYVDFLTKESLVEALSYNEREYMNRNIRVDLATDKNQEGRPGGPGGRPNEPDRTEGDWRRGPSESAPSNSFSSRGDSDSRSSRFGGDRDRERDRGYGFGGDRDRDRRGGGSGFGDRDRGFGGDRDRGFGGDRDRGFGGDRDRGFGGDRDRGFGGDRDRGFGGDRDRGFGGGRDRDRGFGGDRDRGFGGDRDRGFGGDRDRGFGGDRDRGGRYGARDFDDSKFDRQNMDATPCSRDGSRDGGFDRDKRSFGDRDSDRGGRYGGSRGGGYERDDRRRDDYRRQDNGFDRRPRSRDGSLDKSDGPKERPVLKLQPRSKPVEQESSGKASSIFGAAKPVDTYAKEKEMEEKLKKKDDRPDREEPRRREDDSSRPRRSAEDGADRRRKSSSGSGGSEWPRSALPVQKPHVGRRASEDSVSSATENPKSPTSPKPADNPDSKLVPAPPPKENAWAKKREGPPTSPTDSRDSSNNASSAGARRDDRRDDRKPPAGRGRQGGDHPRDRDNKDRRPGGPRANGDGSGGDHQQVKKHQREKKVPKSIEEMPKFEEDRSRDFSTVNKYAFLMADNDDGGDNDSNDEANQGKDAAADVASS